MRSSLQCSRHFPHSAPKFNTLPWNAEVLEDYTLWMIMSLWCMNWVSGSGLVIISASWGVNHNAALLNILNKVPALIVDVLSPRPELLHGGYGPQRLCTWTWLRSLMLQPFPPSSMMSNFSANFCLAFFMRSELMFLATLFWNVAIFCS